MYYTYNLLKIFRYESTYKNFMRLVSLFPWNSEYHKKIIITIMRDDEHHSPNSIIEFGLSKKDFLKWKEDDDYKNIM